jgi:hypothetical protein
MSTIQFDESQFKIRSRRILGEPEVPVIIKVLVTKGVVKTENQAIGILVSVLLIFTAITFFVVNTNTVKLAVLDAEYIK